MTQSLRKLYDSLNEIRVYLIKIGPDRRSKGNILEIKLIEAPDIYKQVQEVIKDIGIKIEKSELGREEVILTNSIVKDINQIFSHILNFDIKKGENVTMTSFDLEVAVSLLAIMVDDENVIKQLIDAIELYDSMLNDDGKHHLTKFVLKTHVNYKTIPTLMGDMKKFLLTKSSDTALQLQLLKTK